MNPSFRGGETIVVFRHGSARPRRALGSAHPQRRKKAACRTPPCSPPSRASTRTSGRAIHRSCSRGSRACRRRATRSGTAAAAAARRASRWRSISQVVHATDVAAEQIAAARPHPRVRYSVAPAEQSGLRRRVGGPGDRGAGAALVRRRCVLCRGAPRRAARRAAGGVELSAPAVRRCGARPAFPRFLHAAWSGRTGRPNGGTSKPTTRRCRFRSEEMRARRRSGSSSTGTFEQVIGLREQLVRDRALSQGARRRTRCRCCANRSAAAWPGEGATRRVRMPLGLRAGRGWRAPR